MRESRQHIHVPISKEEVRVLNIPPFPGTKQERTYRELDITKSFPHLRILVPNDPNAFHPRPGLLHTIRRALLLISVLAFALTIFVLFTLIIFGLFLFKILLLEVGWFEAERYTSLVSVNRKDDRLDLVAFAEAAKS